jgi:hypothetical protein
LNCYSTRITYKQNKTKQNKTKQNKTKQNKTKTKQRQSKDKAKTKQNIMASALKASQVDLTKITISPPKTLDNGGKMMFINYNGGINPLYITVPEVEVPWEPSYFPDNDTAGKYAVKISLKNLDENKDLKDLHTMLSNMDTFLKKKALENSQSWFKKKMSEELINELYTPLVKVSLDLETGEPNGKYPDSFGFKVVKRDNKFKDFSIYDNHKVVFDVEGKDGPPVDLANVLMKGTLIKAVLKCNGIWVANGKFGCTWRAEQIRAKVPEGGLREFAIESDSDDEDEDSGVVEAKPNMIEDSSDEEKEEKEEDEVVEEPEPKKKRKLKVKKKDAN